MEFDTNLHHCGSHRTGTPTPGTCSPVESRQKEGEGVSLQQIHPRKVQLILKSAAAVNTKAPKCFILTLLPDPQNRSPLHVLFTQPGHPWARTERDVLSHWKYTLMRPGGLAVCLSISESVGSTKLTWTQAMNPCFLLLLHQGTQNDQFTAPKLILLKFSLGTASAIPVLCVFLKFPVWSCQRLERSPRTKKMMHQTRFSN